jgi:hypothetical protein
MATNDLKSMTDAEIKAEAAKVLLARNKQRERMKSRGKEKRAFIKTLLAAAAEKGLLPDAKPVAAPTPARKQ